MFRSSEGPTHSSASMVPRSRAVKKFTGGDVGHDDAELGKNFSGKARNPHLQALQIVQRIDLLAEPGVLLGSAHAERHGGKQHRADVLALPVIGGGPISH